MPTCLFLPGLIVTDDVWRQHRPAVEKEKKMGVLDNVEPKAVFHFFEEITRIPHGSGNVDMISDFYKKFAQDRGLKCIQDETRDIIIMKPASTGYENEEPMILQGHMDMVAVKEPDCDIDMKTDPLRVKTDGDYVYAEGTSLGGDDSIAAAYELAILDDDSIPHPELYCILTVNEETGMDGARAIDLTPVKARRLLNLDSEEEGYFLVSCAGGGRVYCRLPLSFETRRGKMYDLKIDGLLGGHSGEMIIKGRANANCLMGRIMHDLISAGIRCSITAVSGGVADNAIPKSCEAAVLVDEADEKRFTEMMPQIEKAIRDEFGVKDPDIRIKLTADSDKAADCRVLTAECMSRAAELLTALPGGVQAMSASIDGLVETSLNMGVLSMDAKVMTAEFSVRSSVESAKTALIARIKAVCELAGADMTTSGEYPGWEYKKDSELRDKMIRVYERMYGRKPVIQAIHAGVECGLLLGKKPDLDCVSIGPDMKDIHTTNEKLSISSVKRMWEYILELLKEKG